MNESMTPERLFVLYTYPCFLNKAFLSMIHSEDEKDRIEQKGAELADLVMGKRVVTREYLESAFPRAIRRIRESAKKHSTDSWSEKAIRTYFLKDHNMIIDARQEEYNAASSALCELCKGRISTVLDFDEQRNVLRVKSDNNSIALIRAGLTAQIHQGDTLSIHAAYAIEILR